MGGHRFVEQRRIKRPELLLGAFVDIDVGGDEDVVVIGHFVALPAGQNIDDEILRAPELMRPNRMGSSKVSES